jgi:GTP cyclohydrolase IA
VNAERIKSLVREMLVEIGEDPDREGLKDTPRRYAEMMQFLCSGYSHEVGAVTGDAFFTQHINNMVVLKDIELYSLCEHHILPFYGRCHIGYIARDKVFGVSKLARIVDMYARRLQLQERLTEQIAHAVRDAIEAQGVGVVIEARHLCMMMRGVRKQNSVMMTSSLLGSFMNNASTRAEFMSLLRR